jgi:preprotein translocase SecE subunit
MLKYLKEVNAESKNIKWPTKKMTTHFTIGVIIISIIFAIYIAGLDFVFSEITNKFIIK